MTKKWLTKEIKIKCSIKCQIYEKTLDRKITKTYYDAYCFHVTLEIENAKIKYNSYYIKL